MQATQLRLHKTVRPRSPSSSWLAGQGWLALTCDGANDITALVVARSANRGISLSGSTAQFVVALSAAKIVVVALTEQHVVTSAT